MILSIGNSARPLNEKGLSLIEVLVSVVILSVGIVGILKPMLNAAGAIGYIKSRAAMKHVLEQRAWEIEDQIRYASRGFSLRGSETLYLTDQVVQTQTQTEPVAGIENLRNLRFRVIWGKGVSKKSIAKNFYAVFPKYKAKKS